MANRPLQQLFSRPRRFSRDADEPSWVDGRVRKNSHTGLQSVLNPAWPESFRASEHAGKDHGLGLSPFGPQ